MRRSTALLLWAASLPVAPAAAQEAEGWAVTELEFFSHLTFAKAKDAPSTFTLGLLDWVATAQLPADFYVLTEVAFEARDEGDFRVDLERVVLSWQPHRAFKLSAGRFHTPLSHWINTYHRALWLTPSVGNPAFVDFEWRGGPLPAHLVGLQIDGIVGLGDSRVGLGYHIGAANGRGPRPDQLLTVQDTNEFKALYGGLRLEAGGFRVGFAGYLDHFPALLDDVTEDIDEVIGMAHLAFLDDRVELLAEGGVVAHEYALRTTLTYGGYAHFGVRLADRFVPYLRGELVEVEPEERYLTGTRDRLGGLGGLRIDATGEVALKAEGGWFLVGEEDVGEWYGAGQVAFHY